MAAGQAAARQAVATHQPEQPSTETAVPGRLAPRGLTWYASKRWRAVRRAASSSACLAFLGSGKRQPPFQRLLLLRAQHLHARNRTLLPPPNPCCDPGAPSDEGAQQLAADLDYFANVLDALGLTPEPVQELVRGYCWRGGTGWFFVARAVSSTDDTHGSPILPHPHVTLTAGRASPPYASRETLKRRRHRTRLAQPTAYHWRTHCWRG